MWYDYLVPNFWSSFPYITIYTFFLLIISFSQLKGILQEKQTESKKLEIKIRHSEEEYSVAQEEIVQEVKL